MLTEVISIAANIYVISIKIVLAVKYYRVKKYSNNYMEIDNLLDQIDSTDVVADNTKKDRLTCVAVSGKSKEYLGKLYSVDEIEKLDEKEITKLYTRYEAALGGHTTKHIKEQIISAYAKVVKLAFPAVSKGRLEVCNTEEMCKSFNDGPFIDLALTSITSKMYHEYGQYMAPLETVLLTSNFVRPVNVLQQEEQLLPQQQEQKQEQKQEQDDDWIL